MEELAENFEPATTSQFTKSLKSSMLLQIKEVSQQKVYKIINKLNKSKAKDVFGLDTAFIKTHCSALINPSGKPVHQRRYILTKLETSYYYSNL